MKLDHIDNKGVIEARVCWGVEAGLFESQLGVGLEDNLVIIITGVADAQWVDPLLVSSGSISVHNVVIKLSVVWGHSPEDGNLVSWGLIVGGGFALTLGKLHEGAWLLIVLVEWDEVSFIGACWLRGQVSDFILEEFGLGRGQVRLSGENSWHGGGVLIPVELELVSLQWLQVLRGDSPVLISGLGLNGQ